MNKQILHSKHPKAMYLLALVEMCQRFAFWGIANLLVLFLVQQHGVSDAFADNLFGIFTGVSFVLPVLGGYIADRWNYRHPVLWGSIMTAIGCFLIATNHLHLIYLALAVVAIAGCIFTPSIYTLLGSVYRDRHHLREAGFSIYYASVNIGVFAALIILGAFGNAQHWSLAFTIAGAVQLLGLIPLYFAFKIPALQNVQNQNKFSLSMKETKPSLTLHDRRRIIVIVVLSFFSILFWMPYNQGGSSLSLFALRFTDRTLGGFTIPPSWLLSSESLYLVLLALPLAGLYLYLSRRQLDPSPPTKTALSLLAIAICFAIMVFASYSIPANATHAAVNPLYLVFAYFFMAIGEMLLAPIGLSLVTHLSPPRFTAMLVGVWYLCLGVAFYLGGAIAGLMSDTLPIGQFFSIFVIASAVPGFILLCLSKKLNKMRHMESL